LLESWINDVADILFVDDCFVTAPNNTKMKKRTIFS